MNVRELAKQAGLTNTNNSPVLFHGTFAQISEFASLVAMEALGKPTKEIIESSVLAEREACAKVCDDLYRNDWKEKSWDEGTIDCASAIRARGNK